MDKLNKTFVKGAVLKADEMNEIVSKINELIEVPGNSSGGSPAIGGLSNVDSSANGISATDDILVRLTDTEKWVPTSLLSLESFKSVTAMSELEAIPKSLLREGMLCYVKEEDQFYVWTGTAWEIKLLGNGGEPGIQRTVRVVNNMEKSFAAQSGQPCVLNFTFVSQERYSSKEPFENTGERGMCQILIKNSANAEYTVVKEFYVNSITPTLFDVAEYLVSGVNSIMVCVTGEVTGETTPAYTYNIQLTTLSLAAPNFHWWTTYLGNITIPFMIGGNISKTLYVSIMGVDNDYSAEYNVNIGTATYTETAYNYSIPYPGSEGVFRVKANISNSDNTIQTKVVQFDIMCAMDGSLKKLMCINNVADKAINWVDNVLFEYAIYDGAATITAATFTVRKDTGNVFQSVEDSITTNARHTFSFPMEIETIDESDFQIWVSVEDNNGKITEDMTFNVENSVGYSAVAGAVFLMNPKSRTNNQANRKYVINEMTGAAISTSWLDFNWGNDGWQTDSEGAKVLRILAGSQCTIDYRPFLKESARTGKTIEFDFRAYNVVDGTDTIINIATPSGESFIGLKISSEEMIMFSQSMHDATTQNLPIDNEVRIRMALTIMPDAYGNGGFNLCCLYVNGVKNRVFNYESNDYFAHEAPIVIGSKEADIDIYGIRVYDAALTSEGIQKNYISWLPTTSEKEKEVEINDVLDSAAKEIDFLNAVDQYNCFVFDKPFPRLSNPSERKGTLEVYFAGNKKPHCTVTNVNFDGQGTSSKKYWEWNVRMRVDKSADSVTTYADGTTENQLINLFPNVTPKMSRITAKKNWASSMQDHKNGSVNAFNDLSKQLGLTNPAIAADNKVRTAVYQEPFIGFSKQLNEDGEWVYTCMGQFTMGPDKGDVNCFGFDKKKYPGLIAIEGSDNAPLATLFRVPWNPNLDRIKYNEEEEAFQYNEANAWDFNAGKEANISLFIPAYNLVYECSNRLRPYNGTLDQLNADVINYRSTGYEYWIAKAGDANQYNVYYYEAAAGLFIPSDIGAGNINLITQLVDKGYGLSTSDLTGKTVDKLNELFIKARIEKFRQEAPAHFDINDAIFHTNFIEFVAGTDNRAKNTYLYNFGGTGDKWKWRQDDMDTIFPIDNQGQDKKPYWVEVHDFYDNGGAVWNGETSNFWNLLELAYPAEITIGMRNMMRAMESLSGMSSGTPYDKIYGFYKKYYLSVKKYFPTTLFNSDAKRYEDAKLSYIAGDYSNDTDPITQSHGDFYSAETAWFKKRVLYMMSKYSYGIFSADGTDIITVRAAGDEIVYNLVPAMDIYPAIASGTSIIRGERTKNGESCQIVIDLGGAGDQQNNIQGASYLKSIGQWHDKNVSGTMIVQGRRLQEITLGHKTEPITISITGLTVSNCPSVRLIDLSRIATLSGSLDVSSCIHLKEIYVEGTSLAQIKLPEGGGLEKVGFSAYNTYLMLRNFPVLRSENVNISLCDEMITDFYVQDCEMINPIDLLIRVMEAQDAQGSNHALKRVRAVGFDATYTESNGAYILDRLAQLANGEYVGLNSEGLAGESNHPVLDGKLTIYADVYENSLDIIRERFPKLELTIKGGFYLRFKDAEFQKLCIAKWGDGQGVTRSMIEAVTTIPAYFAQNSAIVDLSDMKNYFVNLKEVSMYAFANTPNLAIVKLPKSLTSLGGSSFYRSAVSKVIFEDGGTEDLTIKDNVFMGSPDNLRVFVLPANTVMWMSYTTRESGIETLYCKALVPPTIQKGWDDNFEKIDLFVPIGCRERYASATNWSSFKTITEYDFVTNPNEIE
ncbi:leucine-rich repeat protein [Bacteroides sp. 51]|uniref:leucine-rich repeat protein n=1 Tax=Bacteroides sp. 51 TaxID=2302938 RepID=UPI0013D407C3|nr:leucine-rich repeat protein [Bacteroides sp. 51]NDV83639.1 leucine-rich repeat domain-containing protein [Bacteroides sp. 51]